jgi:hypothetical protein
MRSGKPRARNLEKVVLLCFVGGCFALTARKAQAQLVDEYFPGEIPGYQANLNASVVNRIYAQGQSKGVELGDFVIRPQLSESMGYDSNVLGTPGSSSPVLNTGGGLKVNSDWGRDAVGAAVSVNNHQYFNLPIANYTDWSAALGGTVTLGNDALSAGFSHRYAYLSAEDLGVTGVVSPVPYSEDDVRLSYYKSFSRFSLTPSFEYEKFRFGEASGATTISYKGLDHQTEIGALTGQYAVSPGNALVAIIRGTSAQYDTESEGSSNNYNDFAGFMGVDYESGAAVQYRALIGAETRRFTNSNQPTVSTPAAELDVLWEPTTVDTVTGIIGRELNDPASPFASNQTITRFRVQLDHELQRNLFFRSSAEFAKSLSPSNTPEISNLDQNQVNLGARLLWNVNRHVDASLSYGFSSGRTTGGTNEALESSNGSSYVSNSIILGISIFE